MLTEPVRVLAEGADWLVLLKPSGVLVHRTALSAAEDDVFVDRARAALGSKVHPVHRLDRPTSGAMLFARSPEAVPALQESLRTGTKTYLALVRGRADRVDKTWIDRPLTPEGGGEAKPARTWVEVLGSAADPRCSLVLAQPETGRFHQVRRHLRGLDHPVLADSTHGDIRENRTWRPRGLHRLALHCARLDLPHPDGPIHAIAPLPDDLYDLLATLPFHPDAVARAPALLLPR